jgi:hypothetical protein
MRTRHWLANLLGGALWAATATLAFAQSPYDAGMYGGYGAPGFVPYVDPGSPEAAAYAQPFSAYPPVGWPQGATSWPQISPYEAPPIDEHRFHNGFWFNDKTFGGRRYYTTLTATLNKLASPNDTVVGHPEAPQFFGTVVIANQQQQVVGANAFPLFVANDWASVTDSLSGGGFMGMIGYWNADDSGAQFHGFWSEEGTSALRLGLPGVDLNNPTDLVRRAEDLIHRNGAVPLLDDQLPQTILPPDLPNGTGLQVPGGAQPYDLFYRLSYQAQAYGAGLSYYSDPVFEGTNLKLRPALGLRYLNVRENAVFHGADSGLNYVYDLDRDRADPGTITTDLFLVESYLRSNTKAHLGGPEIGLRLDLGSDKFLIWTQSKLALLANHSTREIDGFGIMRAESVLLNGGLVLPGRDQTEFNQQDTTTTVSPLFEQSIFARAPLLAYVPGVKKMKAFESAQFQVGYTFTAVGAMYRPADDVEWRGFPQFPFLTGEKSTWFMTSLSLGVEWMY